MGKHIDMAAKNLRTAFGCCHAGQGLFGQTPLEKESKRKTKKAGKREKREKREKRGIKKGEGRKNCKRGKERENIEQGEREERRAGQHAQAGPLTRRSKEKAVSGDRRF